MFTQVIIPKRKYGHVRQITQSKSDKICPLAIPHQILTISIHIPSLVKIDWCLLKLSFGNEKQMDGPTFVRMDICWVLQCLFFGSKYPTRCLNTQQVPQIYWVLTLDTYWTNIFANKIIYLLRLTDRSISNMIIYSLRSGDTDWLKGLLQTRLYTHTGLVALADWKVYFKHYYILTQVWLYWLTERSISKKSIYSHRSGGTGWLKGLFQKCLYTHSGPVALVDC